MDSERKRGYAHWRTRRRIRDELVGVLLVFGVVSGLAALLSEKGLVPSLLVGLLVAVVLLAVIGVRIDEFVLDRDYELTEAARMEKRRRALKSEIEKSELICYGARYKLYKDVIAEKRTQTQDAEIKVDWPALQKRLEKLRSDFDRLQG